MRLLHGSNVEVKKPDLKECHSKNDFGRGFYLTPSWNRAWEMGKRRVSIQQKGEITVNAFNFNLKKAKEAGLNVASYTGFSVEWARFVIRNRDEEFFHHNYDIVIGPVADIRKSSVSSASSPRRIWKTAPCRFLLTGSINLEAAIPSTASAPTKH